MSDQLISDEQFEAFVVEGIDAIADRFAREMDNVVIVIEDEPSPEQRTKLRLRQHSYLFGLYEGIPKTKRRNYTMALPDKITIFKQPILAVTSTPEQTKQFVKNTVWHEIGHHFGLSDQDIHQIEHQKHS